MQKSKIEWTEYSWNPIVSKLLVVENGRKVERRGYFCTKISTGCAHCYAETFNNRFWNGLEYHRKNESIANLAIDEKRLEKPANMTKGRLIFVCSMTDLFHDRITNDMIRRVFLTMEACKQHTFMVLTKRIDRAFSFLDREFTTILPNVMIGVSVENQETANKRIPVLIQTPARYRFVSIEPMVGPVDLSKWLGDYYCSACKYRGFETGFSDETNDMVCPECGAGDEFASVDCQDVFEDSPRFPIRLVIVGGESGAKSRRPMSENWVSKIKNQCANGEAAFFFKQWGNYIPLNFEQALKTNRAIWVNREGKTESFKAWLKSIGDSEGASSLALQRYGCGYTTMLRVGKKLAGRAIAGRHFNELYLPNDHVGREMFERES